MSTSAEPATVGHSGGDMEVTLYGNKLDVLLMPGERYRAESAWWYALKNELNSCHGYDLVKKIMAKDGHMYGGDTGPYYLRDRNRKFCFYDTEYAVRMVNERERVTLQLHHF